MISFALEAFAKFLKYTRQKFKVVSRKLMKIGVTYLTISRWQEDRNYASESTERRGFLKPLKVIEVGQSNKTIKTICEVSSVPDWMKVTRPQASETRGR